MNEVSNVLLPRRHTLMDEMTRQAALLILFLHFDGLTYSF